MKKENQVKEKEWQVSKTVNDYTIHDGEKDIALVYRYSRGTADDVAEANARLIAAAPELLQLAMKYEEILERESNVPSNQNDRFKNHLRAVRSLLYSINP